VRKLLLLVAIVDRDDKAQVPISPFSFATARVFPHFLKTVMMMSRLRLLHDTERTKEWRTDIIPTLDHKGDPFECLKF
jgi:hypothetical protein